MDVADMGVCGSGVCDVGVAAVLLDVVPVVTMPAPVVCGGGTKGTASPETRGRGRDGDAGVLARRRRRCSGSGGHGLFSLDPTFGEAGEVSVVVEGVALSGGNASVLDDGEVIGEGFDESDGGEGFLGLDCSETVESGGGRGVALLLRPRRPADRSRLLSSSQPFPTSLILPLPLPLGLGLCSP
ncbi:hypothetical protein BKA80DRAFT_280080 [Phyllosticta citrichinensis]